MDKEIIVAVTCQECASEFMGKYILNIRTGSKGHQRINQPLGSLTLADNEVALSCEEAILADQLSAQYTCKNCGKVNEIVIPISDEMKHIDHMI